MTKHREYRYVGPESIIQNLPVNSGRVLVENAETIINWINGSKQPREKGGMVIATFIIDTDNQLWINDRRTEHVLCAAGKNVLSAGEITFESDKSVVEVVEITNQSTGYCPEPASWRAVEHAFDVAGIKHPSDFTMKFIFRLCKTCGTKNIVKDEWFECGVCQSPLSEDWNFDTAD